MHITYDADANAAAFTVSGENVAKTLELLPGFIVDFDANGRFVAFEFLGARECFPPDALSWLIERNQRN